MTERSTGFRLQDAVAEALARLEADPTDLPSHAEIAAVVRQDPDLEALTISELAGACGISTAALRYYEAEGLVRSDRDVNGSRVYDVDAVARVVLITRLRVSGMPIATLRELTSYLDAGPSRADEVRRVLRDHRRDLLRRIAELRLALAVTDFKLSEEVPTDAHSKVKDAT